MTTSTQGTPSTAVQGRWKRRLIVVASAAIAATLVFLVASLVVDGISTPAMNGRASTGLNGGLVFFVAAFVSLVAWGVLALLEKFTAKGRLIWTVLAVVGLLLSLGGPMSGTGITTGNRLILLLLHVVVAAVLIPFLPARPPGAR